MSCYDAIAIRRLTAIQLDSCGAIPDTGTPALKGLAGAVQLFTNTRNLDVPQDNPTKTINGSTCVKPRATPTDRGRTVGLTWCGQNPIFEVVIGYKTLDLSGATITGFEDIVISTLQKVAIEVIFEPSVDACAGGATAKCPAVLYPAVEQWVLSGDTQFNGTDQPDLVTTGQTALSKYLFNNYADAGDLPAYLSHWAPKFDAIGTGRSWSYTALIDCPEDTVDDEDPCTLVAL